MKTETEFFNNIEYFKNKILEGSDEEKQYCFEYIKHSKFLIDAGKNTDIFLPSELVGYSNITIEKHKETVGFSEEEINNAISHILCEEPEELIYLDDIRFNDFCSDIGIIPENKNIEYWVVQNRMR